MVWFPFPQQQLCITADETQLAQKFLQRPHGNVCRQGAMAQYPPVLGHRMTHKSYVL